jgi:hypothetical protein
MSPPLIKTRNGVLIIERDGTEVTVKAPKPKPGVPASPPRPAPKGKLPPPKPGPATTLIISPTGIEPTDWETFVARTDVSDVETTLTALCIRDPEAIVRELLAPIAKPYSFIKVRVTAGDLAAGIDVDRLKPAFDAGGRQLKGIALLIDPWTDSDL